MGASTSMYDSMMRPVAQVSPIDMATKAMDLKLAMARSQLLPAEAQKAQADAQRAQDEAAQIHQRTQTAAEDAADQQTTQKVYGEVQNDATVPAEKKHDEFISRLAGQVKPRTIDLLNTQMDAHDKAVRDATKENLDSTIKANTEVHNQLAPVQNAPQYTAARQSLIRQGIAKPEDIPETYDPATVAYHDAAAQGATNSAKAEIERREQANKDAAEARAAGTDERAKAAQEVDQFATLPPDQQQDAYANWRSGKSPGFQALTAATYSPQNVANIHRLGLTAEQQQQATQATATEAETQRHNQAEEARATAKPTYSGEMRAALVAVGADPDKPTPEQANAALAKLRTSTTDKPASRAALTAIEQRKSAAIQKSKATLDKELAANTVKGKVLDQDAADQAWEDHIQRSQDAQTAYENELTTATGGDVGHNDWADRLRVPGKAGAPQPSGQTTPPAAAAPTAASASAALPPRPTAIPKGATAQYNPARKQWRYSVDGGKSWQQPTGQ